MSTITRSEKLDLRLTAEAKSMLQAAAAALNTSVSEFVLESALARAQEALPARQRFGLDADAWAQFQKVLDAPATLKPRLDGLLREKSRFERASKE